MHALALPLNLSIASALVDLEAIREQESSASDSSRSCTSRIDLYADSGPLCVGLLKVREFIKDLANMSNVPGLDASGSLPNYIAHIED